MRIDPPRDQPSASDDDSRLVEEAARASSAIEKTQDREKGGGSAFRSFPEILERVESGGDSSVALDDPDRDQWTQEVIGARIHWQYGPDARRKPFFRKQTRRLDEHGPDSEPGAPAG